MTSLRKKFEPLGAKALERQPFAVKLPSELAEYLRAVPNKNQWLIAAVAEKVAKEQASFSCQDHHDYIPCWQAIDALMMRCKVCGVERSPTPEELTAMIGTVVSVRDNYQH
jgi:hypothetical protein